MQKLTLKGHKDNKDEEKEEKNPPIQNKDSQSKAMFSPWSVETI